MSGRRLVDTCRKIVCVGRNYKAHAAELGNAVPSKPMLFLKPPSSLLLPGDGPIEIPREVTELHHEVELGVVIGDTGRDVAEADAMKLVDGYVLALDMTARNLQQEAKEKGHPWSVAKGYDTFCPISDVVAKERVADPSNVRLWCSVDGEMRQDGNTKDMIFSIPTLISYISRIFTLQRGDLVLTGTPSGVGPIAPGQSITAGLDADPAVTITFPCVQRQ
ncbi:fumarylacetoacetate hydrolase domain-containing protein 1 [Salpingoeca rosetta]|uniref:Fumarylacetoacetate hydrolase domain-containing protein 1 n=1 Tax=Salpingoeca rosetta (strain ATCC 50818 / BSB-021) TaxID=946362 RepID=F2U6G4_SALR5|nr:fumarylacetoacetate hydrolase domain-containing protein 1 [Salpingoeca rosetta]EGD83105.1 fumarylacetoacetate hydrolase domain-containing protein 1 [Salpingoeca rosetta]|eukprot:XP_004995469.1 fumarylacetoacetate hydrolase domain-containing protein 1 [Salpingoeca rosetta]